MNYKVFGFILFSVVLVSCTENKIFSIEKNGGNQPFEKSYKLKLSNDSLFLSAKNNLPLKGEYYRVIEKEEKKKLLSSIEQLDLNNLNNSSGGGTQYFFYWKDKKEEVTRNISGFIPKNYKMFGSEIEKVIKNSNWIKYK